MATAANETKKKRKRNRKKRTNERNAKMYRAHRINVACHCQQRPNNNSNSVRRTYRRNTNRQTTHTHKIIMNVGHKNSPKRSTHTETHSACTCKKAHAHVYTRKHSTHGAGNNKMKNGIPECLTRHSGARAIIL